MSDAVEAKRYLEVLDQRLKARNPEIQLWENYYDGIHRLQFATSRFRANFGNLFREFADNWCELVINASVERMKVIGFRTESGTVEADADASEIWRDNAGALQQKMAFTEACKFGTAYFFVDAEHTVEDTNSPLITVEHPAQTITHHDPSNRRRRLAGMKQWQDDAGRLLATVYLPDTVYRFQAEEKRQASTPGSTLLASGLQAQTDYMSAPSSGAAVEWVPRAGAPFEVENKLGVVPLVPIENNPTIKGGRSDLSVVIPIQDAINKELMDMIVASEFAAFMQRWATGIEIPKDPQTGKPLARQDFLASVGRLWAVEDPDAKFGQFQASDLKNYVVAIEMLIQHLAALTKTPPHYLLGQSGNFPSGDSLTATETGLTAKVESKWDDLDPSLCETTNLAFKAKGIDRRAQETIWKDAERRIRSQRIDGAVKLSTLGVPQDGIWGDELGYTPEQIARFHEMKESMGLDPHSSEFAVPPIEEAPGEGPEGNQKQQQAVSQAARVARVK